MPLGIVSSTVSKANDLKFITVNSLVFTVIIGVTKRTLADDFLCDQDFLTEVT